MLIYTPSRYTGTLSFIWSCVSVQWTRVSLVFTGFLNLFSTNTLEGNICLYYVHQLVPHFVFLPLSAEQILYSLFIRAFYAENS